MNHSRTVWLFGAWIIIAVCLAILAPVFAPYDPIQPVTDPLTPPREHRPMGSDNLGRDMWSRILFGARTTISASLLSAGITVAIGIIIGMVAAASHGMLDRLIIGGANTVLAIPGLLLALLLVAGLGPGFSTVILAIGIAGIPGFVRLSRTVFQQTYQEGYITAAEAMGAGAVRIAFSHVLPNALRTLAPLVTTHIAWAMMGVTTLTFLGLAGDPSFPEWGVMLESGRAFLFIAPWMSLIPGTLISLTIISVHELGETLSARTPGG
jgi:ABC-type dipeptide/oligopeptide/nickel transport system permease subunit